MDFEDFVAQINDDGKRIDKVLRVLIPNTSLSEIYRLLRKKFIKVNDKISIPKFALNQNQDNSSSSRIDKHFCEENFHPVFENEHILILDKPYNLNVHGDEFSLESIVQDYYHSTRVDNSISFKPGPLHRLDKKTTGLVAFSMSLQGARWFCKNIENHKIQKIYYTIMEGKIEDSVQWDDFIENNHENKNNYYKVTAFSEKNLNNNNAKNASMQVFPLANGKFDGNDVTFVKIILKTGRKHQIRCQSALHSFPLLGDSIYGSKKNLQKLGFKQDLFLQAAELIIPQNPINLPSCIKIPLNEKFIFLLKSCGIQKTDI